MNNEIDKRKKEKENLIKTFEEEKSVLKNNIQDLNNQLENNNKTHMAKISEANKEIQNLKILCNKLQSEKKGYEIQINNSTKKVKKKRKKLIKIILTKIILIKM